MYRYFAFDKFEDNLLADAIDGIQCIVAVLLGDAGEGCAGLLFAGVDDAFADVLVQAAEAEQELGGVHDKRSKDWRCSVCAGAWLLFQVGASSLIQLAVHLINWPRDTSG